MNWLIHIYLIANTVIICESESGDNKYNGVCKDMQDEDENDCLKKIHECNVSDPEKRQEMSEDCLKTCKFCTGFDGSYTPLLQICTDLQSEDKNDCLKNIHECNVSDPEKRQEMSEDCLKTCKFCTGFDGSYTPLLQNLTAITYQTSASKRPLSVVELLPSASSQILSTNSLKNNKKGSCLQKKTIDGKCCVFPFIYKSAIYDECTTFDNDGVPWCSTDSIYREPRGNCSDISVSNDTKCNTLCEPVGTDPIMQYCNFSTGSTKNAAAQLCGDSIFFNNMMMFPRELENRTIISILKDFYDEYIISFDMYFNDSNIEAASLLLLSSYSTRDSTSVIDCYLLHSAEKGKEFKVVFDYAIFLTILQMNTWNSIRVQQYFNGSYINTIIVNGIVEFIQANTEPKIFFNTTVEVPLQVDKKFALKNIYIVSKTQVLWSEWTKWSSCNSTITSRSRFCHSNQWFNCTGNGTEISSCVSSQLETQETTSTTSDILSHVSSSTVLNNIKSEVDGMWGNWSISECSTTCGGGATVYFNRSCNNPSPAFNGRICLGDNNYTKDCQDDNICPENGNWSNWSAWSLCSQPCKGGVMSRFRSCSMPKYGGQYCHGNSSETINCKCRLCKKADLNLGIYLPTVHYQSYYSDPKHPGSGELKDDIEKEITNFYKNSKKNVTFKIKLNSIIKGNP